MLRCVGRGGIFPVINNLDGKKVSCQLQDLAASSLYSISRTLDGHHSGSRRFGDEINPSSLPGIKRIPRTLSRQSPHYTFCQLAQLHITINVCTLLFRDSCCTHIGSESLWMSGNVDRKPCYFDIAAGCAAKCVTCKAHSRCCNRVSAATVVDDKCAW